MTQNPSFASFKRTYRPWGQVRRKNLIARTIYVLSMTLLGLAVLAGMTLLVIFAASVAVVGVAALMFMALAAFVLRTPARIFIRSRQPRDNGKGLYTARKSGSTWSVY